uniref:Fibrinogen C-terminal domain-containing protein n=1 Tax=Macrostomum lignano TaxID=282301 RepID=A0A1I8HQ08_9PLAT
MQQRISGSVSFVRSWTEYENGFGDADNFWIGLKTFRSLTPGTVRFEFTKFNGSQYHCEYDGFTIGDETSKYTMDYSRYASERSNITMDSLQERSRGMKFSTTDQDNDQHSADCSDSYGGGGGWWFGACFRANPNGEYSNTEVWKQTKYLNWYYIDGEFVSLRETRIMVQLDG